MEHNFILRQIGTAHTGEEGFYLAIAPQYREALAGLEEFRYINVLWWFSGCDNSMSRKSCGSASPMSAARRCWALSPPERRSGPIPSP